MRRPPIVGAAMWSEVAARTDGWCSCDGQCGGSHPPGGFDCEDVEVVAPKTPMPPHEAVQVPADELVGWCGACWGRMVRRAAKDRAADHDPPALF